VAFHWENIDWKRVVRELKNLNTFYLQYLEAFFLLDYLEHFLFEFNRLLLNANNNELDWSLRERSFKRK
jgi:hypothetical protein